MPEAMRLAGETAIVTGAASGIRRAIACTFAAQGANAVLADVRATPRSATANRSWRRRSRRGSS